MKKLVYAVIVTSLVLITARGAVAALSLQEQAAVQQLMGFEARRVMLEVCGVTGDEADRYLANDIAQTPQLEASLSDAGKKSLRVERAHAREAIERSWDATPADQRDKACESITSSMAR